MTTKKAIGGLVAMGFVVLLFLWLRGGDDEPVPPVASAEGDGPQRRGKAVTKTRTPQSRPDANTDKPRAPVRYVRDDGTVVNDHRPNATPENLDRRITLPPNISPVTPQAVANLSRSLYPAAMGCIRQVRENAEEGATVRAEVTVSVADSVLTVNEVTVTMKGVRDEEPLRACMVDAFLGHELTVEGAEDVKAHVMRFPYNL